ncbi:hypothetical protein Tcan_09379 [Toxocara canis]|uniref:Tetraspanin-11 n=1 Tax=Toxocara canis TaxID=6265 RepID=A0A0B2VRY0_TOXCA|nr:hypothetical protein Tcan_09379 [Toxocara canis]
MQVIFIVEDDKLSAKRYFQTPKSSPVSSKEQQASTSSVKEEGENRLEQKKRSGQTDVLLLLHFLQIVLCLSALLACTAGIFRFATYKKVLRHVTQREGLFASVLSVSLLSLLVTAIGVIRIYNCRRTSMPVQSNLFAIAVSDGVAASGILICAIVMLLGSRVWRESIRQNIQNVIKESLENPDSAEEINRVQSQFECCGTPMNHSQPMQIWLYVLNADSAFRDELFGAYGHLPWSCCNHRELSTCQHLGLQRYLITFDEIAYEQYSTYSNHINKKWECTSLSECKQKRNSVLRSVNKDDCAIAFFNAFRLHFFIPVGVIFVALGYPKCARTRCKELLT